MHIIFYMHIVSFNLSKICKTTILFTPGIIDGLCDVSISRRVTKQIYKASVDGYVSKG